MSQKQLQPWSLSVSGKAGDIKLKVTNNKTHVFQQGVQAQKRLEELLMFKVEGVTLVAVSKCDYMEDILIVAFVSDECVKEHSKPKESLTLKEHQVAGKANIENIGEAAFAEAVSKHSGALRIKIALLTYDLVCDVNDCGVADNCVGKAKLSRVISILIKKPCEKKEEDLLEALLGNVCKEGKCEPKK